jgi:hypothetical protein
METLRDDLAKLVDANIGRYERELDILHNAYQKGIPVVVVATAASGGGALHGLQELEVAIDKGIGMEAMVINGIDRQDWEATDCPEVCEVFRQIYYLKVDEPLLEEDASPFVAKWGAGKRRSH